MFVGSYLLIVTCGFGIIVALTVGVSCLFTRWYGKPKRSSSLASPADFALPCEVVTFPSHGKTLAGWFMPAPGISTRRPTIITVHGWSFDKSSMLPVARDLHRAGFHVFAFDARGHGSSSGDGPVTILKFAEDIVSAVHYLEGRLDVDRSRLGVVGHSMGGASGILATSMDPRICALVSVSAFADPLSLTRRYMKRYHIPEWPFLRFVSCCIEGWLGSPMDSVAPYRRIGDVQAPVLLVHGDSDRFIPHEDMEAIWLNSRKEQTERWLVSGRRHADVHLDPEYGQRVSNFLLKTLCLAS